MKFFKKGIAILLISTIAFMSFGCHGKYALFNTLHKWNGSLGSKWVNSIVHFILWIIPVYGICLWVDWLILNTVEFWTGSNPLAMNDGEREQQIVNKDGVNYEITATKNRFDVLVLDGEKAGTMASLVYNDNTMTWSVEGSGETFEVAQVDSDNPDQLRLMFPGTEGKLVDVNQM